MAANASIAFVQGLSDKLKVNGLVNVTMSTSNYGQFCTLNTSISSSVIGISNATIVGTFYTNASQNALFLNYSFGASTNVFNLTINVSFYFASVSGVVFNVISGSAINVSNSSCTYNSSTTLPASSNSSFGGFVATSSSTSINTINLNILSVITFAANY